MRLLARRFHSARASRSWITNGWRGGFPKLALGEHMCRAALPNAIGSASFILRSRARNLSRSTASDVNCEEESIEFARRVSVRNNYEGPPGQVTAL